MESSDYIPDHPPYDGYFLGKFLVLKEKNTRFQGLVRPKILVCAVCLGDHSDDLNEIVTCDGCSVSVHEGCYGISDSASVSSTVSSCSTEPWFCDACKAGVVNPPCELCPNLGKFVEVINSYSYCKVYEVGNRVGFHEVD